MQARGYCGADTGRTPRHRTHDLVATKIRCERVGTLVLIGLGWCHTPIDQPATQVFPVPLDVLKLAMDVFVMSGLVAFVEGMAKRAPSAFHRLMRDVH
jgi:hypothetical protein